MPGGRGRGRRGKSPDPYLRGGSYYKKAPLTQSEGGGQKSTIATSGFGKEGGILLGDERFSSVKKEKKEKKQHVGGGKERTASLFKLGEGPSKALGRERGKKRRAPITPAPNVGKRHFSFQGEGDQGEKKKEKGSKKTAPSAPHAEKGSYFHGKRPNVHTRKGKKRRKKKNL